MGQSLFTLLGGGLQVAGYLEQGAGAQAAAEFNSAIAERKGRQQELSIRKEGRRYRGRMRAAIAKSGITLSGSAMDAIAESAVNAEMDALNARNSADLEARLSRMQGKSQRRQANLMAGAKAINTLSTAFSQGAAGLLTGGAGGA